MKNSKNKKLSLKKLKIAKLDNAHLVIAGSIIYNPTGTVDSDNQRDCPADSKGCPSRVDCTITIIVIRR